ncbi:hypothetical protein SALBM311S_09660 [Streptomyces alboniger]
MDSLALPSFFLPFTESVSMTRQNGQAVETMSGFSDSASSTRSLLMRLPIRSSIHIRAPPAPQQKPRSLCRCISSLRRPGTPAMISRGGV